MSDDLKDSTGLRQRNQPLKQEQKIHNAFTSEKNEHERPAHMAIYLPLITVITILTFD